jgi:hypothetical protein
MKASQILERREQLRKKEEDRMTSQQEEMKKKVQLEKIKSAKKIIEFIKFKPNADEILNYLADEAHIEDDKQSGYVSIADEIDHYSDIDGVWKCLIPVSTRHYWPYIDDCIPTRKVKPAILKNYFKEIEKVCDIKCWWGYGHMSHTSYNLKVNVLHNLVMYFEFK